MSTNFGKLLREKLIDHGIPLIYALQGCSKDQIEEIRVAQQVKRIPETYYQFLLSMGRGGFEGVWGGSEFMYPHLLEIKEWALKLIEENKQLPVYGKKIADYELPKDAFVFFIHQGCHFRYFCTQETGDDPPVFGYVEEQDNPVERWETLSQFFISQIEGRAKFLKP